VTSRAFPAFVPELADDPNADRVVMVDEDHEWTEAEVEAHADARPRVIVVDVD
jgi:hypothetical protein